jgi:F0F1-type ATP synthase membrane subunit b/b'
MDAMFRALGDLLIRGVPTFILVLALTQFLKAVFFRPMEKTLKQRFDSTEGALARAAEIASRTESRSAEYDSAVRGVRAEAYRDLEQLHRQLEERRGAELASARAAAHQALEGAKAEIAAQATAARGQLSVDAEALSSEIAASLLGRSAA